MRGLAASPQQVFVIWALVRASLYWRNVRLTRKIAAIAPLLEVAAFLVAVTAYYGGMLVFDLGVNVAHSS